MTAAAAGPALDPAVGRLHEVVTPEGVPLQLEVAGAGDRLGALLLDLLLMSVVVVGLPLGIGLGGLGLEGDAIEAVMILTWFVVWTCYFPFFELAWQGQTPGKRAVKIRAVDARGGPLTAEAVLARNVARQFELMLPLMAVFSLPGSGWFDLAALGWMVALGFLPLFNADRLRIGDMIAGTIVIRVPTARLLEDLTARAPAAYAFTEEQLDVYGVYELQVLEGVLRGADTPGHLEALRTVSEKIREKIGWAAPVPADEAFLQAFYAALRGRLEKRLLFGKRRRSKHDRG
jgi:uncharacterized RDD family membrane protein YckC